MVLSDTQQDIDHGVCVRAVRFNQGVGDGKKTRDVCMCDSVKDLMQSEKKKKNILQKTYHPCNHSLTVTIKK